jgi:hypothetical protein
LKRILRNLFKVKQRKKYIIDQNVKERHVGKETIKKQSVRLSGVSPVNILMHRNLFHVQHSRDYTSPKREEDGSWRKLHNDELHSLYSSPNIVRMIKSRGMRWAGHVARMGEGRGVSRV